MPWRHLWIIALAVLLLILALFGLFRVERGTLTRRPGPLQARLADGRPASDGRAAAWSLGALAQGVLNPRLAYAVSSAEGWPSG